MTSILSNNFNKKKIFKNKKIVLCHGVFDLLHLGHIKYFKSAKKFGDILIVSVTSDRFVNKGPGRPVFNLKERIQFLSEISCIDYICVSDDNTAVKIINKVKPNFYCKGPDYSYKQIKKDINLKKEIFATKKNSGKFISIKEQSFSSSKLINSNEMQDLDETCKKFINAMNKKYGLQKIIHEIKKIEKLKVLVIGETIIDKYIFTETVGKSGKEPILIFKKINEKKFLGGIGYIANLISSFAKNVKIASFLGDNRNEINFIKKKLNKKINYNFFIKKNSPTINKLRYVDEYRKSKIFGVYDINDSFISENEEKKFIKYIRKEIKKHDVIIVADYGHGMMTKNIRNEIFKHKNKVFCLVGDGECHEGTVWENANIAHNLNLGNLCVIVDWNGSAAQLMPKDDLAEKWKAFGWDTFQIFGHSNEEMSELFNKLDFNSNSNPKVVLAKTTKGKGVSFIEGHGKWHHKVPNDLEMNQILKELK